MTHGILENFLARKRAKTANNLIPPNCRKGRILDIGCGSFPFFLLNTDFAEKYGLDRINNAQQQEALKNKNISFLECDIENSNGLPYENNYFDAITMLAVFEHIKPQETLDILQEIYRILKPGGIYVLTTPSARAVWPLKIMAKIKLINSALLAEHKYAYNLKEILDIFAKTPFDIKNLRGGYFEFGMNIWTIAQKLKSPRLAGGF